MATASMVLGIIGLVFVLSGTGSFIGCILGLIALILASISKSRQPNVKKGQATAGLVMGIIAFVLGLLFAVACVACVGAIVDAASNDSTLLELMERFEEFDWESLEDVHNFRELENAFESF